MAEGLWAPRIELTVRFRVVLDGDTAKHHPEFPHQLSWDSPRVRTGEGVLGSEELRSIQVAIQVAIRRPRSSGDRAAVS